MREGLTKHDFSRFISEMGQDRAIVIMERQ